MATDNASTYNDTTIGTGTKFWDTSSTDVQKDSNNYGQSVFGEAHWSTNLVGHQPDDNGPFLTVGYGSDNQWDDANFGGETTVGFVRETNSANSSLKINTGDGAVNLQGNIGGSQKLDTVTVNTTGDVTTGGSKITDYNMGTIHADHGVTIKGQNVTIGGRISSGASTETVNTDSSVVTDNVTITAARDITVHGITADGKTDENGKVTNGGKIKLTSTADNGVNNGVIKLESTANSNKNDYTVGNNKHEGDKEKDDGTLIAGSTENGAVIVDAQGKTGAFINETQGSSAITTGVVKDENGKVNKEGTWQVYVASPSDYDTKLGDNLNSKTNAQWSSESTRKSTTDESDKNAAGHNIGTYTDTSSNKFIFQVTPVITVSAGNYGKTYGDTLADNTWKKVNVSATYTASDGVTPVDVSKFSTNFQEDYVNYIENGSTKGLSNVTTSTNGAKATATRTKGDEVKADGTYKTANDKQRAFYNINVDYATGTTGANGYALGKKNGEIEITKRTARITATGNQVYGDKSISWTDPTNPKDNNIADRSKVTYDTSVKSGSAYTDNRKDRNTADSGTYKDSVSFDNLKIIDAEGHDVDIAANYDLTTTGTIDVAKAKLNINIDDTSATYGSSEWTPYTYKLDKLVNGDTSASITVGDWQNGGIRTDSTDKDVKTQGVGGSYQLTGKFELTGDTAKNYEIGTVNPGKAIVNPKDIYIYAEGNGSTLGDVTWTQITKDDLVNGDKWDNGFPLRVEPGNPISYADKTFGIKGYVNGQPISDGTQIGNYIYHPKGIVQLTFNPIVKPDVWAHSGGYRPRNKIETSLPVFRVEDAKVGQYGTYGVEHNEEGDRLVLSATGMRLPEPDQVPDEERTFTTTLSTETGSGTFKLVYNGVSLKVYPQDKEAEETVRAGDKTKNVSLSEKALYVGYTEMGLDLIDLKGVYIYFN